MNERNGPGGRRPPPKGLGGDRRDGGNGGPAALLPLYHGSGAPRLEPTSHRGLWFDRFFAAYVREADGTLAIDKSRKDKQKRSHLDQWLAALVQEQWGDPERLASYAERLRRLVVAQGGTVRRFAADWNFVTGMGLPHPLENGLAWHPTLGTPYLPASGVKGLVRAFLSDWTDLEERHPGLIDRWFGPHQEDLPVGERGAAGTYIFFDAVPTAPPALTVDVMTPHQGNWYAEGGSIKADAAGRLPPDQLPADWHDPIPIKFVAVRAIELQFAIAPRHPAAAAATPEGLDTLFAGLEQALGGLGAGAKTAAGYGRFRRVGAEN